MRFVWLACVWTAACYQTPAFESSSCTLRCERTCPDGLRCEGGFCVVPGETCNGAGGDAGTDVDAGADASVTPATACISDVALGRRHTCVVKNDGTVWCTGDNTYGQLGNNSKVDSGGVAVQVVDVAGPITDATAVAAGWGHSCAIRAGGTVWCWGLGRWGQLGHDVFAASSRAVQVVTNDSTRSPLGSVVQLEIGEEHVCARDAAGAVWCWGDNYRGELGDYSSADQAAAVQVMSSSTGSALAGAIDLSLDREYSCAQTANMDVYCWGRNDDGQLGRGFTSWGEYSASVSTLVGTAAQLDAGRLHACARSNAGEVTCWGSGKHYRLGNGARPSVLTPAKLTLPGGSPFTGATALAMAGISCALMENQQVMCWGDNVHGQHGNGASSITPVTVSLPSGQPLTGVTRLEAGYAHVCAFRAGGEVLCWGRGQSGELGGTQLESVGHPTPLGIACD